MNLDFGGYLAECLNAGKISQNHFAGLMGTSSGFVNMLISGQRRPPLEWLERWAEVLKLTGVRRQRFFDLAEIAHLPKPLRRKWVDWYYQHVQLLGDYQDLERRTRRAAER